MSARYSSTERGQSARIISLDFDKLHLHRLAELGFIPGERVRLLRKAPLGDPLHIEIMNYELCLRKEEASSIQVHLLESRE